MKPILFNTEMVRAILDGRKTVTRRAVKFPEGMTGRLPSDGSRNILFYPGGIKYPPYTPGDILYVRETWGQPFAPDSNEIHYRADYGMKDRVLREGPYPDAIPVPDIKWHPSIHMPKEAARIFLRVTDVRAEHLQSIKTWQCVDEGAVKKPNYTKRHDLVCHDRYRNEFAALWDSTIKPADLPLYGWEANPWVWVISFKRCEKPQEAK